jgi:purine-binding chemotaxis protein CheW
MADNIPNHWLVFTLSDQHYAVAARHIEQLFARRELDLHKLPLMSEHTVGVAYIRGRAIEVRDVRTSLGLPPLGNDIDELLDLLEQRERDHVRWLAELEASVRERREFRLATDPHKCKFGLWYDKIMCDPAALAEFTGGDIELTSILEQFDTPHQKIHGIAKQTFDLLATGESAEALKLLETTRHNELDAMVRLFRRCRQLICDLRNGLVLVLNIEGSLFGITADAIKRVATFSQSDIDVSCAASGPNRLMAGIVCEPQTDRIIQLLDAGGLAHFCVVA